MNNVVFFLLFANCLSYFAVYAEISKNRTHDVFLTEKSATSFITSKRFFYGRRIPESPLKGMSFAAVKSSMVGECCSGGGCSSEEINEFQRNVPMHANTLIDIQCEIGLREERTCICAGQMCGLAYYGANNRCKNPCKRNTQFHCHHSKFAATHWSTRIFLISSLRTPDSQFCSPIAKHCDSNKDCPGGEDEKGCNIMKKLTDDVVFSTAEFKPYYMAVAQKTFDNKYAGAAHVNNRPICEHTNNADGISEKTATVFCRTMREPNVGPNTRGVTFSFGYDARKKHTFNNYLMADVQCKGDERHIGLCSHVTYSDACKNVFGDVAGIACLDATQLKLDGGSSKYEGKVSYIGANLRLSMDQNSEEARTVGRSICSTIFGEEFGRREKGVPFFKYNGFKRSPGPCIRPRCRDPKNIDFNKCDLKFEVECFTIPAANLSCAKCNQKKLIEITNSITNTGKTSDVLESLKSAQLKLKSDCRNWDDCTGNDAKAQYPEYCMVKEFIENALYTIQPMTKGDVVLIPNEYVDTAKMLELNKLDLKFDEEKEAILNVGEKLAVGVSQYFKSLASFDSDIAKADLAYAHAKWKDSKKKAQSVQIDIDGVLKDIINAAIAVADQAKKDVDMAAAFSFISALNPENYASFDLSGLQGVADSFDAANAAERDLKVLNFMPDLLKEMRMQVDKLATEMQRNKEMFVQINYLVTNSALGTSIVNFETASSFLKAYNDFSPAVSKNGIASYISKIEEMVDKCCVMIEDAETTTEEASKEVEKKSCTKVREMLASIGAFFDDLEEQQFDIMDSFARMARSKIAEKEAQSIAEFTKGSEFQVKKTILKKNLKLVLRTQRTLYIEARCNYLTYIQHGIEHPQCVRLRENPDLSVNAITAQDDVEICSRGNSRVIRSVKRIPISSIRAEDGFLNLTALYERRNRYELGTTTFRIPGRQWLLDNNWIYPSDIGPFYIQKININLPPGSIYEYVYQLDILFSGNRIGNKIYVVGDGQMITNQYTENKKSCDTVHKVNSHYSVNECKGKLRDVCVNSEGDVKNKLLPVLIGSTWHITMSSVAQLKPLNLTDDHIFAHVEFCSLAKKRNTRDEVALPKSQDEVNTIMRNDSSQSYEKRFYGEKRDCCPAGQVWKEANKFCMTCPQGYQPYLWDRYCELCPPGYSSGKGPFGCEPCKVNEFKMKNGPGKCLPCPEGFEAQGRALSHCTRKDKPAKDFY